MKQSKFDPEKLRRLRIKAGMTYLDLSRALNKYGNKISKTSVWGWERGDHVPSLKALNVMSSFFSVPIDFFMK